MLSLYVPLRAACTAGSLRSVPKTWIATSTRAVLQYSTRLMACEYASSPVEQPEHLLHVLALLQVIGLGGGDVRMGADAQQLARDLLRRQHEVNVAARDGVARHAVVPCGTRLLREGDAAFILDRCNPERAVG